MNTSWGLVAIVVGSLAPTALAHGGRFQAPPRPALPRNSAVPPGLLRRRATTPRERNPATTPNGPGPTTGGEPGARALRTYGSLDAGPWTDWWYANRASLLRSSRVAERFRAARTGGEEDTDPRTELWRAEARAELIAALAESDPDIASGAAVAVGKAGNPHDTAVLAAVLADGGRDGTVREAAALGLGLLPADGGEASTAARARLAAVLVDEAEPERLRAVATYALGLRGETASVPLLLEAARSGGGGWDVPAAGVSALGLGSHELIRGDLEKLLAGPAGARERADDGVRRVYAAHALRLLGGEDSLPALRRAAADSDVEVARAAVLALGSLAAEDDPVTVQQLISTLGRARMPASRAVAALALGELGGERAERALRYFRGTGPPALKPYCTLGLGLLARGPGHETLRGRLRTDLSQSPTGDGCVAVGLAQDLEAAPVLRAIVRNRRWDGEIRAHAALALGMVGDREEGAEVLRSVLSRTSSAALRRESALALGMLGDRRAILVLLEQLQRGETAHAKGSAAVALGRIGGREVSATLVDMLRDEGEPPLARAMCAVAIGMLLDRSGGSRLSEVGADLNWFLFTPTVHELLTVL